mmetsp:Transcript_31746/g.82830  ORF Transcript_31746/g.82830 Transcript_31746/m.82830 type:complete len:188 (-) Transcript_31746:246-809(-)|eukprot:CAMPEP_0113867028 /NCGR_PEP_ID=MMETSP0780_2-20120614/195_1 /TAXON_ID=652834 /ORGANISM="Palpitomonas bilix" /LENGTH=187 /DNA_ID=CAMNT_0000851933 /DNA_START=337 /DNA_END=900 /DNA_ORIENTATION=+ /assembly_acc=CAM_ASM_000599
MGKAKDEQQSSETKERSAFSFPAEAPPRGAHDRGDDADFTVPKRPELKKWIREREERQARERRAQNSRVPSSTPLHSKPPLGIGRPQFNSNEKRELSHASRSSELAIILPRSCGPRVDGAHVGYKRVTKGRHGHASVRISSRPSASLGREEWQDGPSEDFLEEIRQMKAEMENEKEVGGGLFYLAPE